jgi:hypothetical protein
MSKPGKRSKGRSQEKCQNALYQQHDNRDCALQQKVSA